ncbi:MAG: hypothetical protein R2853_03040 [Thermomicrobiales bacterium]
MTRLITFVSRAGARGARCGWLDFEQEPGGVPEIEFPHLLPDSDPDRMSTIEDLVAAYRPT